MGVPVTHQRRSELSASAALNWVEDLFRIQCAGSQLAHSHRLKKGCIAKLLAFIEHNPVPLHLMQNTTGFVLGGESCIGGQYHVVVGKSSWRCWPRRAVEPADVEGIGCDMSEGWMLAGIQSDIGELRIGNPSCDTFQFLFPTLSRPLLIFDPGVC